MREIKLTPEGAPGVRVDLEAMRREADAAREARLVRFDVFGIDYVADPGPPNDKMDRQLTTIWVEGDGDPLIKVSGRHDEKACKALVRVHLNAFAIGEAAGRIKLQGELRLLLAAPGFDQVEPRQARFG